MIIEEYSIFMVIASKTSDNNKVVLFNVFIETTIQSTTKCFHSQQSLSIHLDKDLSKIPSGFPTKPELYLPQLISTKLSFF